MKNLSVSRDGIHSMVQFTKMTVQECSQMAPLSQELTMLFNLKLIIIKRGIIILWSKRWRFQSWMNQLYKNKNWETKKFRLLLNRWSCLSKERRRNKRSWMPNQELLFTITKSVKHSTHSMVFSIMKMVPFLSSMVKKSMERTAMSKVNLEALKFLIET